VVASAIVRFFLDPEDDRVAHDDVGRGHVDLGPENTGPLFELSARIRSNRSKFSSTDRFR
jgi:hypothetical protein